jgi:hypothetical protein
MCDKPCTDTCDCTCLENIKSLELLCAKDGIPCECDKTTLQIRAPVEVKIPEMFPEMTPEIKETAKTWKTFFARFFPMLSCTSEVAVSVQ